MEEEVKMQLSGQCEESFEKWLTKQGEYLRIYFDLFPDNAKYGVFEDFFDSVGIEFESEIYRSLNGRKLGYYIKLKEHKNDSHIGRLLKLVTENTKPEARTEAINKANEIHNDRKK